MTGCTSIEDPHFEPFPKIARLSREIVVTEKIDGTNAQVFITDDGRVLAGSRNRWLTPESDNFGFAAWVHANQFNLKQLGQGRHYGEWWGAGVQRGYGLSERRFSLFDVDRWQDWKPDCCYVVPVLYRGDFDTAAINEALDLLRDEGSRAAPGYRNPEGVIIYHTAAGMMFKKTIHRDDVSKTRHAKGKS